MEDLNATLHRCEDNEKRENAFSRRPVRFANIPFGTQFRIMFNDEHVIDVLTNKRGYDNVYIKVERLRGQNWTHDDAEDWLLMDNIFRPTAPGRNEEPHVPEGKWSIIAREIFNDSTFTTGKQMCEEWIKRIKESAENPILHFWHAGFFTIPNPDMGKKDWNFPIWDFGDVEEDIEHIQKYKG